MCFLYINGRLSPSSSKLKVKGLCGVQHQSFEFSLDSPTEYGYKFENYKHIEPEITESELSIIVMYIASCMIAKYIRISIHLV